MSLIFLLGFLFEAAADVPFEYLTYEHLVVWALFAIADALWFKNLFGKGGGNAKNHD